MHGSIAARRAVLAVALALVFCPRHAPAQAAGAPLFRVILEDGTALVSLGEFARVGDRVIFSMPLGPAALQRSQVVNLPASKVNWESTSRYAESVRYAQYIATRAELDYAALTGEVAAALAEIAGTKDPARRLQIAESVRRMVTAWPGSHFGYRSAEVRDMATLLEETISELRAIGGVREFELSLVAAIDPPNMPLLPEPSAAQTIEQAMVAARASDVPAERLTLLRAVLAILEESDSLPANWRRLAKASAEATLAAELNVERRYSSLSRDALRAADRAVAKADVRGVERAIRDARRRNDRYGAKRPAEFAAVLATLGERLDSARRLRVMRDQWTLRARAFEEYKDAIARPLDAMDGLRASLDDIRAMAGPPVGQLPVVASRFDRVYRDLAIVKAPPEMSSAHATLLSSVDLAVQAARRRLRAVMEGDVGAAREASSAAAGAAMLLAQARQSIEVLSSPPELK